MLGPLITAIPTPFMENNQINEKLVVQFIKYLANNGSDAIVVAGTTGEGTALSVDEKVNLFKLALSNAPKNLKVIANIGTNYTEDSLSILKRIDYLPFAGYMVIVPYYVKPTQKGMFEHFKTIANATNKPIMIYNVPSRVATRIEYETIACLITTCPNIKALKHVSNDLELVSKLKTNYPHFEVYSGEDKNLLTALRKGCDGVVSVISNAFGNDVKELIEDFNKGIENEKLSEYLNLITDLAFIETNPGPIKYILTKKGFDFKRLRLPLVEIDRTNAEKIDAVLGD